jgi:hypothetical protein
VLDNEFELGRITPLVVELWKLQWSNSIGSYAKKILITGAWLFALVHVFKGSSVFISTQMESYTDELTLHAAGFATANLTA